jgi:hypothetical protein
MICYCFARGGLDRGDVDLSHGHHCVHRALGRSAIRVRRRTRIAIQEYQRPLAGWAGRTCETFPKCLQSRFFGNFKVSSPFGMSLYRTTVTHLELIGNQ